MAPLLLNFSAKLYSMHCYNWPVGWATSLDRVRFHQDPLLNKSVGELLATQANLRTFERGKIISITSPTTADGFKRFTARINNGGKTAFFIRYQARRQDAFSGDNRGVV